MLKYEKYSVNILCLNSKFLSPKLRFMVLKYKIKFANIYILISYTWFQGMIDDPNKVQTLTI